MEDASLRFLFFWYVPEVRSTRLSDEGPVSRNLDFGTGRGRRARERGKEGKSRDRQIDQCQGSWEKGKVRYSE